MGHAFRRRAVAGLAALIAILAIPASAFALGPGGWDDLGERGTGSAVAALDGRVDVISTRVPSELLVGGAFTAAGQPAGATSDDDHIALWTGKSWHSIGTGTGLNGDVHALEYSNGKIYAGGVFVNAGGDPGADFLAVWDTHSATPSWQPPCGSGAIGGSVDALAVIGGTLYVGGAFQDGAGLKPADYLLACDLATGTPSSLFLVDGDGTGSIKAMAVDANGDLYVGGNFINYDQIAAADYVAKYHPPTGAWSSLGGSGIDTTGVDSLAAIGNDVYVGTDDVDVAGIPQADHVVRWNGAAWSAVGSNAAGTDGYFPAVSDVQSLTSSGSTLFASGNWQNANGDPLADSVASFDGGAWSHVGSNGAGTNGPFGGNLNRGLAVWNGGLFVGGNFADAGGDSLADSIACYSLAAGVHCGAPPNGPAIQPPPSTASTPPSNSFGVASKASCAGACRALKVVLTFESAGNVVAEQALAGRATGHTATGSKTAKPKPLVKKLTKAVSPGANTLTLKLTAAGQKQLKKAGSLRVKMRFTFTPTGGSAKGQVKALTIKLPKKKADAA
jgi:hypothetical protein